MTQPQDRIITALSRQELTTRDIVHKTGLRSEVVMPILLSLQKKGRLATDNVDGTRIWRLA